jgi:hypothetical protein
MHEEQGNDSTPHTYRSQTSVCFIITCSAYKITKWVEGFRIDCICISAKYTIASRTTQKFACKEQGRADLI